MLPRHHQRALKWPPHSSHYTRPHTDTVTHSMSTSVPPSHSTVTASWQRTAGKRGGPRLEYAMKKNENSRMISKTRCITPHNSSLNGKICWEKNNHAFLACVQLSNVFELKCPLQCKILENESETKYEPVVLSSFHLDAVIDGAVDAGLGAVPAVLTN